MKTSNAPSLVIFNRLPLTHYAKLAVVSLAALAFVAPVRLAAQPVAVAAESRPYELYSGIHTNAGTTTETAFSEVIQATNLNRLRLHFSAHDLGQNSFVLLTSLRDGRQQRLDAQSLGYWGNTSAILSGDSVRLDLHVAPGEQGIYVIMDRIIGSCDCEATPLPASLCGADNRVPTTDNRVGRIGGCTAWLVSNGAVLTAGHCRSLLTSPFMVFEVNVPPSQTNGMPNPADPNDQFPIDTNSVVVRDGGTGDDWAVFRILPNGNTGQRAHERFGFFRMTAELPPGFPTLRVTGYGIDSTPLAQSQTLQTSTGGLGGIGATTIKHTVDTRNGNSGSPIILEGTSFTLGIHTDGGCSFLFDNKGTSFRVSALAAALQAFPGPDTVYVDLQRFSSAEDGTVYRPYDSLPEAASAVSDGGIISMVTGQYTAAAGNRNITLGADGRSIRIEAPVGSVTIGR